MGRDVKEIHRREEGEVRLCKISVMIRHAPIAGSSS